MTDACRAAAALLVACLFVGGVARADDLPSSPKRCPNGTRAVTGPEGPTCRPWVCASDGDCDKGASCVEQEVCLLPQTGGKPGPSDEPRHLCDAGGRCEAPAYCAPARVCVSKDAAPGEALPAPPETKRSCKGCATPSRTDGAASAAPGLLFAAALFARARLRATKST